MVSLQIDIWHGELDANPLAEAYYRSFLDDCEQLYALNLKNPSVRQRYIEVHARLRMVLSHYLTQAPTSLLFVKAEHGKPYLPDFPKLGFNLSHTANYLAIAVAENSTLGIDIEHIKVRKNISGLVDKCFADNEKDYWQTLPEQQQLSAFYRFWTGKEAFVKATGQGISLGLNQCGINPETMTDFSQLPAEFQLAEKWLLRGFDLTESICGSVVVKSADLLNLQQLSISPYPLFILQ